MHQKAGAHLLKRISKVLNLMSAGKVNRTLCNQHL
jgi:hypothetical protein